MAALGEFERVVYEVRQHLREAHRVADGLHGHVRRDRGRQVEPLRLRPLAEQRHHRIDDLGRLHGDALELELARLDLREIEDVVDDGEQALARARDHLGVAALAVGQVGRGEELGHHQHAVHGRADLVAHRREELGLRPVRDFRRLFRLLEVVGALQNLLFEVLAVLGEAMVALADLAHHLAEARGQHANFVVALDIDGGAVVVGLTNRRHGLAQSDERARDRALEAKRDHKPDRHG
jgi:hypothetical protein